jgi:hypothetical protein
MGTFLYVASFRTDHRQEVIDALLEAATSAGLVTTSRSDDAVDWLAVDERADPWLSLQFQQLEIDWRKEFERLTAVHECLGVFASIEDGDHWTVLIRDGSESLFSFDSSKRLVRESHLGALSARLGTNKDVLRGYLVQERGKVQTPDEFEADDPWIVSDFLSYLGISALRAGNWQTRFHFARP